MRAIIEIECPITWFERCKWITNNCPGYVDKTEWAAWQIGYDIIRYEIDTEDAIVYKLTWKEYDNRN